MANKGLIVKVHHLLYPVTVEVLHQVFDPYGVVEEITLLPHQTQLQALVRYKSIQCAVLAQFQLDGRCIYDDCCWMDIHFLELQEEELGELPEDCPQEEDSAFNEVEAINSKEDSTNEVETEPPSIALLPTSRLRRVSSSQVSDDDTVYVAVGKEFEESILTLLWALPNFSGKFCLLHVHHPASSSTMIPLIGGKYPASRLEQFELREVQELERKITHKIMDDYLRICRQTRVNADMLCIEMDDIGKGIVELVYQHNIKKLVMGAATNKHYAEGMAELESKKAKYVQQRVPLSCHVWFICNGHLVHTREGDSSYSSTNSFPDPNFDTLERTEESGLELELCEVPRSEEDSDLHTPEALEGSGIDELYSQLDRAMVEAERFKREAYEESLRRGEAERTAINAISRVKALENLYKMELGRRKETEEALSREREYHQRKKQEWDDEHLTTKDQRLLMTIQIAGYDNKITELENELLSMVEQCKEYRKERDKLQVELDNTLKLAEELTKNQSEESSSTHMDQFLSVFSLSEIEEATGNFDPSKKIGEGGYGSIYKGFLRHTQVAIKVLNSDSMQGPSEFKQEVDMLTKLRHPNLVTLIGACFEAYALVYEYLPNGNLEDRLICKDNTPPLSWQARIRIATELCSVLVFLHSSTPHSIVHGDLKPANILLDANLACKLSDFGICRALSLDENSRETLFHRTDPKGTFLYLDPQFLMTGELSPKSDTYSFGVILLQLLTGKSAFGITRGIKDVIDEGDLKSLLDPLAGEWPFVQAKQLARVALRCCEMNRSNRPDLPSEVWRVLKTMRDFCGASPSFKFCSQDIQQPPTYFICPILQEVMQDPKVAADGFTYESEAVTGWLDSGHDTSPMTNLRLKNFNLIPNHSLRSAIQEWLQQN